MKREAGYAPCVWGARDGVSADGVVVGAVLPLEADVVCAHGSDARVADGGAAVDVGMEQETLGPWVLRAWWLAGVSVACFMASPACTTTL